jgi:MSHA pilin protein MshD
MFIDAPGRQRGLSLIELIMFMVIMGVAAGGVMSLLSLSSKNSADPIRRKQAMLIAESLLEEVEQARFTFCDPVDANALTATSVAGCALYPEGLGPENGAGNARPYDNVNDYGSAAAPGAPLQSFLVGGKLADAYGAVLGNGNPLSGFTATVALNVVPLAAPLGPTGLQVSSSFQPANMNVLRITLAVTYGTGPNDSVTLDGYRTRYAPNNIP